MSLPVPITHLPYGVLLQVLEKMPAEPLVRFSQTSKRAANITELHWRKSAATSLLLKSMTVFERIELLKKERATFFNLVIRTVSPQRYSIQMLSHAIICYIHLCGNSFKWWINLFANEIYKDYASYTNLWIEGSTTRPDEVTAGRRALLPVGLTTVYKRMLTASTEEQLEKFFANYMDATAIFLAFGVLNGDTLQKAVKSFPHPRYT